MTRYTTLAGALVVLGIALLVTPVLFPLQPVSHHDTGRSVMGNESQIEQQGLEIVAYENLSERGQELYVQTLRSDGEYSVPIDEGASDFRYPTDAELGEVQNYTVRNRLEYIVIERSPNADLPPADEPIERAEYMTEGDEEGETASNRSEAEIRRQIARYDAMSTKTTKPSLTASSSLLRLLSAVVGVLAIGTGGYLRTKP